MSTIEKTNKKYLLCLLCCILTSIITCFITYDIVSYYRKREYNKLQESYSQVWFERNMYAENYYREIGKDDLADSFSVTKPFED